MRNDFRVADRRHLSVSFLLQFIVALISGATVATAQSSGSFSRTGDMIGTRTQHSATLIPSGQVLIVGGVSYSGPSKTLATAEIYDPSAGMFRAAKAMLTARRLHSATLLPDDKVLIVGGYGEDGTALASAELFDPATGSFVPTSSLNTPRGGHTAILLDTGEVLVVGGYGVNTYPNIAPAELYNPDSGTFRPAGAYVGRGGCDFCAPATRLPDGTVLFPGQTPAQIYDPLSDSFSPSGMMRNYESGAAVLSNGNVLFAGGEDIGRSASAEIYDPITHSFSATAFMSARRVGHTLTSLPNGTVLAAGGETDSCSAGFCIFAGTISSAELYDASTRTFVLAGQMTADRETHTATVLADGRVLVAGGVSYGGIGIFHGSLSSAELYAPDVLIAGPMIAPLSRDGRGDSSIFHAGTSDPVTPADPAAAGESVDIYCTGLAVGNTFRPQVAIGGRLAAVVSVSNVPGLAGIVAVRARVPSVATNTAVAVRVTSADRPSNEVTMPVR
jgi:hypothetical protein